MPLDVHSKVNSLRRKSGGVSTPLQGNRMIIISQPSFISKTAAFVSQSSTSRQQASLFDPFLNPFLLAFNYYFQQYNV